MGNPPSHALNMLAAARRLRATPELTLFYVKYGVNGQAGRWLAMIEDGENNLFRLAELDEFDAFLWARWADGLASWPAIPKGIRDYLKIEAGGDCARCVTGLPLEEAHIEPWAVSLSHHHLNLLRLCRNYHRLT